MVVKMRISAFPAILIFILSSSLVTAQIKWLEVGVDGLTCSQCSRSVEMSIRKLDFVQDVEMNLANTLGKIILKPGTVADFNKVAQAVVNAGFSVRYLSIDFSFSNNAINNNYCFQYEGRQFQFLNTGEKILNGETIIKLVGKKFQSPKEYKHWKNLIVPACDKTKGDIFYVTL